MSTSSPILQIERTHNLYLRFTKAMDNNQSTNDQDTSKIGGKMMIIAWVIAIALLTWIFGNSEKSQINPNTNPDTGYIDGAYQVDLTRNRYGHYVTTGKINGHEVTFLIDTGATSVAVPGELQQQLGLISGNVRYSQTANGTAKSYFTEIDSLQIGDIHLNGVQAAILPNMEGKGVLLGMSVLKQLEFSQKGNQLILRQAY